MSKKYSHLISLIESNEKYKINDKLEKIILYLKDNYGIEVKLTSYNVTLEEELIQWKNCFLYIDIRNKGLMGTLFMISHVFGHLIQYSSNKDYSNLLNIVNGELPLKLSNKQKKNYFEYEKEAFQIGKGLMINVFDFNDDFDNLYISFMYADYGHYWNYLVSGKISCIEKFNERWFNIINSGLKETITPIFPKIKINKSKIKSISITIV